jgi:four helix bundle protein
MDDFKELPIFRQAYVLCLAVFRATDAPYEAKERPLFDDLRRAALRIGAVIAKGHALREDRPFHRALATALGMSVQVDVLLTVAAEFEYVTGRALTELRPQVNALINELTILVRNRA